MGGWDFLKILYSDLKLPNIKVILFTGSIPSEKDFPPGGFYQDIICKSFNIDDVITSVDRLLGDSDYKYSDSIR